ncbi:hypothetical protein SS50377_22522 [Spironucleus salmonicida]|uniref:Uncharacterized protein n=1 Tax=Spironucleus salmonicida TaxID=348837 RepID=V6LMN9_9EUKA|nr:hypothetical protein SS50377_22522 [Spironucleus salmonicida]|eukprot:EST41989.1 Hypothetical protein SS50377_18294 [Spironucleus salmonicida]
MALQFPDHLMFQEPNYCQIKPYCLKIQQKITQFDATKSYQAVKELGQLIEQCKIIGISQQFALVIDKIQNQITQEQQANSISLKQQKSQRSQKFSDEYYAELSNNYDKLMLDNQKLSSDYYILQQKFNKVTDEKNILQLKLQSLQQEINQNNLDLSKSQQSCSNILQTQFFQNQQSQLASINSNLSLNTQSQQSLNNNSLTQSSMNGSELSDTSTEISKFTMEVQVISFETSTLNHFKLLAYETKIKDYIRVYKVQQLYLEGKEKARIQKNEQRYLKILKENQYAYNKKQELLLKSEQELQNKLITTRQFQEEKETQKKYQLEEEARRKQQMIDDKQDFENKKIQFKLDAERTRIESKLAKSKQKYGLQ